MISKGMLKAMGELALEEVENSSVHGKAEAELIRTVFAAVEKFEKSTGLIPRGLICRFHIEVDNDLDPPPYGYNTWELKFTSGEEQ